MAQGRGIYVRCVHCGIPHSPDEVKCPRTGKALKLPATAATLERLNDVIVGPLPNARMELGEPVKLNRTTWECMGKLVRRRATEDTASRTLIMRMGHGHTALEARLDAVKKLSTMLDTTRPPAMGHAHRPAVTGAHRAPATSAVVARGARRSWFARLFGKA